MDTNILHPTKVGSWKSLWHVLAEQHGWRPNPKHLWNHWESFHGFYRFGNRLLVNVKSPILQLYFGRGLSAQIQCQSHCWAVFQKKSEWGFMTETNLYCNQEISKDFARKWKGSVPQSLFACPWKSKLNCSVGLLAKSSKWNSPFH